MRDPQPRDFERLRAADHALGGRSGEPRRGAMLLGQGRFGDVNEMVKYADIDARERRQTTANQAPPKTGDGLGPPRAASACRCHRNVSTFSGSALLRGCGPVATHRSMRMGHL
jgi:hypothetical protein